MKRMRTTGFVGAVILSSALAACAGSGSGSGAGNTSTPSGTVSGSAAKGLLLNAPVTFYAVTNGIAGTTAIGTTTTNSQNGSFASTVASSGPVVVTVSVNGSTQMLDELSGTAIAAPSGLVLHAVFDSLTNLQPISVTPLTEMAYQKALAASGGLTTTNIDAANNAVSTLFLGGAPALYTPPIALSGFTSATVAEQAQAKLLTALDIAANSGVAVDASGKACTGTYSQELVCLVGGLGGLLTISGSGVSPTANAGYLTEAYNALDNDASTTVDGGESPAQLGLDTVTTAESSFDSAYQQQDLPLPGFATGGDPLTDTKDLMANIRTNIVDPTQSASFGYASTLTALDSDLQQNVSPVLSGTGSMISAAYLGAQLLEFDLGSDGNGTSSALLGNPVGLAADGSGNLYVGQVNDTVLKISTTGSVTLLAGEANVAGQANGAVSGATFTYPFAIALDSSGNVYVGDVGTVREISAGSVSTLAGTAGTVGTTDAVGSAARFVVPIAMTVDASNNLYVVDEGGAGGTAIRKIAPGGSVSTIARSTLLDGAFGIAVDGSGNLYVANSTSDIVQEITQAGVISTFAGQSGVPGDANGTGTGATFKGPTGLTIDTSGDLYVGDTGNSAVREITPAGVVTTVAQTPIWGNGVLNPNRFGGSGLVLSGGNLYAAYPAHNSIQEVAAGVVSTLAHGVTNYQGPCGYDPAGLGTGPNTVLCRYGHGQNQAELTLTQTGTGTYAVETQPLANSAACTGGNSVVPCPLAPVAGMTPLDAQLTLSTTGGAQSASFTGPYYVTATGGQVTATSLGASEAADWNEVTGTGTITLGGSLSGGSGGVSLQSAMIGSDSSITVQNIFSWSRSVAAVVAAHGPALTISGTVDLQQLTTDAFSYAAKASLGMPVYDASGTVAIPQSISLTGSVEQVASGGDTPLFSGMVALDEQGFAAYDITQPYSATNFFTTQAQVSGTLTFSGSRVLTVTAAASATQKVPTPTQPDSLSVTYSYSIPAGTAQLNASGQYDATHGYSGTITNNAGVVIAVSKPVSGTLTGTVTASGTQTATINGDFVYFSDQTSQSLF